MVHAPTPLIVLLMDTISRYCTVLTNIVDDPPTLEDAPPNPLSLRYLPLQRRRLHWLSMQIRDLLQKYAEIWSGSTSKKYELFYSWAFQWDCVYKQCRDHVYTDDVVAAVIMERFTILGGNRVGMFYKRLLSETYTKSFSRRPKTTTPTKEEIEQDRATLVLLLANARTIISTYYGAFYKELVFK